jgi:hypothetical protein
MSLLGPPTTDDAESRASADQSDVAADQQSNSEILKHPRAFLLAESPLDRIDRINGSLHLGQSVQPEATLVVTAQRVEAEPAHEVIKPADIEVPDTRPPQEDLPRGAVDIEPQISEIQPALSLPARHTAELPVEATASSPPAQPIVSPHAAPPIVALDARSGALDGSSAVAVAKSAEAPDLPDPDPRVIAPIDNAPVITSNGAGASASVSVAENATAVTTVTATDLDAGATLTYSIVGGADAAKFTLNNSTGALSFVSAPDYENPADAGGNNIYDVTVQVSDGTLTDTQAIAVTVTSINDNAPVITSNGAGATASVSVAENATAVTTVTATDLDAGATLTYSIAGGADAAKFTIDASTGALSFVSAPDYENPTDAGGNNVYDVTVQVSDGTLTDTQAIAVTVTDVNDTGSGNAPVITSNGAGASASVNVAENATAVTTVTATDLDAGATLT